MQQETQLQELNNNEWENIRQTNAEMNEQFNKVDSSRIEKKELPLDSNGHLSVFWYDAHYEEYGGDGTVLLFGKCFDPKT